VGIAERSAVVRTVLVAASAVAALATGVVLAACLPSAAAPVPVSAARVLASAAPVPASVAPVATEAAASPHSAPPPNFCRWNHRVKLVRVSIPRQRAWFCAGAHTVRSIAVTTGAVRLAHRATPTGWFAIEGRARSVTLAPDTGGRFHVRYWIPFSGTAYGFHDSPWQRFPLGSSRYRQRGSHGCVHMSLGALRFLYGWGTTGTPVHILG
jgi:lipoprotein-anchoring transpeptidase ErfK/SrfK